MLLIRFYLNFYLFPFRFHQSIKKIEIMKIYYWLRKSFSVIDLTPARLWLSSYNIIYFHIYLVLCGLNLFLTETSPLFIDILERETCVWVSYNRRCFDLLNLIVALTPDTYLIALRTTAVLNLRCCSKWWLNFKPIAF